MLTLSECIEFCELSEDEISVIAEHEHLSTIVAAEFTEHLMHRANGSCHIRHLLLDEIHRAERRGHAVRTTQLRHVLNHFEAAHPECMQTGSAMPPMRSALVHYATA